MFLRTAFDVVITGKPLVTTAICDITLAQGYFYLIWQVCDRPKTNFAEQSLV
ncbi:hypothetical protein [Dendronalium sp. ChiSLP03b]|uniref:hypothetical protein n=1 Tax=Dendronalium sp. ChiSLP03b TaxID=3075381 RepID=UPI002AD495EB|nr:hypothetical protein [Dendronalium sp. ChiSLP03b]MDZ8207144.1 hypothetical protein [Dendronalium sp. ChiSLP03b]